MDKDRILERLKKDLRSLLIASKDGLSIQELEHDYRMLIGSPLPVKSLEYRSTIELLYDMQDVVTVQSKADGTITLIGVVNKETKGIAKLVSEQKTRRRRAIRRRFPISRYHVDLVRRGRIAPVLPAALKNDLQDLLSISPLLVSELETAFYNRFGRSFQYARYGFYSLLEVLRSVSDLVQVNQTRAGSLLMLKTPYISGTFTGFSAKPVINRPYNQVTPIKSHPCIPKGGAQYTKTKPSNKDFLLPSSTTTTTTTTTTLATEHMSTPSATIPSTCTAPTASSTGRMPASSVTAMSTGSTAAPSAIALFTGPTQTDSATALPAGPMPAPSATALPTGSMPAPSATVPSTCPMPEQSATALSPGSRPERSATAPSTSPTSATASSTVHRPAPSATAESTDPTVLDKLFKAAEAQYYASKYSIKNDAKVNVNSETGDSTVNSIVETTKTPPRSLPPAVIWDTSSNLLVQPTPIVETVTADNTCLATDDSKVGLMETSMDCNLQELEEKMDKNLKLCLSKRAGSIISPELRQEIKNVVLKYPEGLSISKFSVLYKEYTGQNLPFRELGFMSALDLVGSLGDMLSLERTKDGEWCLFAAVTECKENVTGKALLHNDNVSRWNSAAENSKPVKPLVIKISSADGNQLIPQNLKLSRKAQEIPPDAVRKQKLHSLPCMKRDFVIGVFVENVTSPSEFYIRCYSKDTSQKLEDLMLEMRRCYSNENVLERYVVPDNCVSVGEIYAVRVDGDVWWYRVIVHSVINSKEVQVYYPDFGHLATVKRQWLRFLKVCYMKLPAQAVPSSLAFVKPVEDQWSTEALKIFQQYHTRGPLVGVVAQYALGRLYLFLCDTTTDNDVYLHQLLINLRLANMDQDPGYYKDLQQCNTFLHYLIESSEQPQEESEEPTVLCEKSTAEKEAIVQVKEKTELKMNFLEAFPSGEDVFDESWPFLESTESVNDQLKPSFKNKDLQSPNPSQEPVNGCANSTDTDCFHPPLEEFYISLIKSRNSLETASASPPANRGLCGNSEIPQPITDHIPTITPEEEKPSPQNKSLMVFQESLSDDKAIKGNSPLTGFQKFKISRSPTAMALGPAARMAASPCTWLNWFSD